MKTMWYAILFLGLGILPACKNCCKKECRPTEKVVKVAHSEQETKHKENYSAIQA